MDIEGMEIVLDISGTGIIFYSPPFADHIAEGSDYLTSSYSDERQVQSHIQNGSIVAFGTGTPGTFILKFHSGYPEEQYIQKCEFKLRLGLVCSGGVVCFRDLYNLLQWRPDCPPGQTIQLQDGYYHVTLCSNPPESGVLGDNQTIDFYFQQLDSFPALSKQGIPMLCG